MKLLYLGQPGTPRAAAFAQFLEEHAGSVTVSSIADLAELSFVGVDVAIVDGDRLHEPTPPRKGLTIGF